MRESRTYGSVRGACDETHVPTATCARQSWCDPAGESPAQVKGSVLLGSECCVATGDSGCEAYTAIAWGVGLSLVRSDILGADSFHSREGNMCGIAMRGADALPGSKATSRAKGSYRNLGYLLSPVWPPLSSVCKVRRSASGRRGAVADDARAREVGPRQSSCEAGEQSEEIPCGGVCRGGRSGAGGAKGGDQGECGPAKHVPGAEPDKRVTGAGTHTGMEDHTPELRAVCGKAARTVLCGGRAMKRTSLPLRAPGKAGAIQPVKVRPKNRRAPF